MKKRIAKRMVKRFLKKSTFTDEQILKFTEYVERYLSTTEGTNATKFLKPENFIDRLTDWIAEQPDYDDQFWVASRPKKKAWWRR